MLFAPSFSLPTRRLAAAALALAIIVQVGLGTGSAAGAEPLANEPLTGRLAAVQPTETPAAASPQPAAASPQPAAAPPAPVIDVDVAGDLNAALQRARPRSGAPGLSLAVLADDGRHWANTSGTRQNGGKLWVANVLPIGSVTKTFTAAIVLELVEEGRIELDVPANRYLPKVRLLRQVTVRQLLNHTSGIADLYRPMKGRLSGAPGRALSSNDVLGSIGRRTFAPGRGYAYSNTNYYLLGHIIEVVTHRSFEEELQARFTGPLGLGSTRMLTAADRLLPPAWSTAFWTSGAMMSTPSNLAAWGRALYGGEILSRPGMRRMLDFRPGRPYGLGAQQLSLGKRHVPGHSGLLYNTTTLLFRLPEEGVTVAIIGTGPNVDLERVLVRRFGGRSLLEEIRRLGT